MLRMTPDTDRRGNKREALVHTTDARQPELASDSEREAVEQPDGVTFKEFKKK